MKADSALEDDIRYELVSLSANDCMRRMDSEHREQVRQLVCAPTDTSHSLRRHLDLSFRILVRVFVCGLADANEKLLDVVQKEEHGNKPAVPA